MSCFISLLLILRRPCCTQISNWLVSFLLRLRIEFKAKRWREMLALHRTQCENMKQNGGTFFRCASAPEIPSFFCKHEIILFGVLKKRSRYTTRRTRFQFLFSNLIFPFTNATYLFFKMLVCACIKFKIDALFECKARKIGQVNRFL